MMFCSNCGKELPDGAAFCTYCGEKLESPSEAAKNKENGDDYDSNSIKLSCNGNFDKKNNTWELSFELPDSTIEADGSVTNIKPGKGFNLVINQFRQKPSNSFQHYDAVLDGSYQISPLEKNKINIMPDTKNKINIFEADPSEFLNLEKAG